jgi:hypothetical protein
MSLFKKSKGGEGVPDWANFFTKEEYENFMDIISGYFAKYDVEFEIEDGVALLKNPHRGYDNFGLINLGQTCRISPPEEWESNIADFFRSMERTHEFEQELESKLTDFEFVRPFIGLRIYNAGFMDSVGQENFIFRPLTEQVVTMLVFDLPDSIKNISPDTVEPWGKTIDELFTLGYENSKESYPFNVEKETFGESDFWLNHGDHFFAPNIVLSLNDENKHLVGTHGALVGLPHRHIALIYPIENLGVLGAINTLIPVIYGMYEEGPGSISNELYWYKDGQLHNLPYEMTEEELNFSPPDDFFELLNSLEESK